LQVQIILEDDNPNFRKPYKLNEVEKGFNSRLDNKIVGHKLGGTIDLRVNVP
jgi:hypothetical protein